VSQEGGKPTTLIPERARPGLFEAYGVEIEMMIVDREDLDVNPICDRLIASVAGAPVAEVELEDVAWSNELTLHVLELKTNGPAPSLSGLAARFQENVRTANARLSEMGARLMPGAMHPWMDPATETRLWPHEYTEVYRAFDRIFGCHGHGWSNLQSTHLNLPFADDEDFGRLHAAVRIVLPLIPGLAASSPFIDGRHSGSLDGRMAAYRGNARRIPSVAGSVIPEPVFSRRDYEREILGRIYADLEPHDPEGVLRYEWVNARGAIARFDRGAIEIRVIDAQERPRADLAVLAAVVSVVRALTVGRLADRDLTADPSTAALAGLLDHAVVNADAAVVEDPAILSVLGLPARPAKLVDSWKTLLDASPPDDPEGEWVEPLESILGGGTLARRMLGLAGPRPTRSDLRRVAETLCTCLEDDVSLPAVR
jgi:gamma-glutamyl:cysteine ligase YbdK (ATP-grasp superfamily)